MSNDKMAEPGAKNVSPRPMAPATNPQGGAKGMNIGRGNGIKSDSMSAIGKSIIATSTALNCGKSKIR